MTIATSPPLNTPLRTLEQARRDLGIAEVYRGAPVRVRETEYLFPPHPIFDEPPLDHGYRWASLRERWESRIVPEPNSGCWLWTGSTSGNGYGFIGVQGRRVLVHRLAFEVARGPIPENLVIDHLCRTRCCVNPGHLETVTFQENVRRGEAGIAAKVAAAKITHCPNGHEYTPENTQLYTGRRRCRTCANGQKRERRRAQREGGS